MGDAGLFQMDLQSDLQKLFGFLVLLLRRIQNSKILDGRPPQRGDPFPWRHGCHNLSCADTGRDSGYEDPAESCSVDYAHGGPLRP